MTLQPVKLSGPQKHHNGSFPQLESHMPFDAVKFTMHLRKRAGKHSQSSCAKFVRLALEAGGADTNGHPVPAKLYGPTLVRHGNQAGHIAAYDGKNWISDFIQQGFWPGPNYAKEKPSYVVYRR